MKKLFQCETCNWIHDDDANIGECFDCGIEICVNGPDYHCKTSVFNKNICVACDDKRGGAKQRNQMAQCPPKKK